MLARQDRGKHLLRPTLPSLASGTEAIGGKVVLQLTEGISTLVPESQPPGHAYHCAGRGRLIELRPHGPLVPPQINRLRCPPRRTGHAGADALPGGLLA